MKIVIAPDSYKGSIYAPDAAKAMEIGADAVLVNTAIAVSDNPIAMGKAFQMGVDAGRMAFEARLGAQSVQAAASSPLTAFLD